MADSVAENVASEAAAALNETMNGTEAVNGTARVPSTPEGMAVAYSSLVVMALIPIFVGAFRSVRYHKEQKESGEKGETMTSKDAAMFPIIASCTLFGLYMFFQIFSKEYINLLLAFYFFFLGVLALAHILSPVVNALIPASFPNQDYHLKFAQGKPDKEEELMDYHFDRKDLVCLGICTAIGVWYLMKKHWVANNLFGLAFALNGVELLQLNSVTTGCILLGGLFIYDIFWVFGSSQVFGTNVMVSVAKSFEAPIKLVFPQDILEKGLEANNFAMLGLGDIVIPGIFIALLLRFDVSLKKDSKLYFYCSFIAYFVGLLVTIFIMHVFKHAQPALLYLVPACVGAPLFVALVKGELVQMSGYEDSPEEKTAEGTANDKEGKQEVKKDK
ncbi:minor histocompatibility antigen H13-like isoform X1 [Branchiostoma floridae]|uniref:Minor histocompatibility antigen H13-like isoform X1 n=2 Tax=Branchiostoma floridae TaxID=7739 RepID=A0A9J7MH77_BRAFL|nr:minor histocompatibility antigen H13-like isoform X1 [Branchiostoma floridae]